MSVHPRRVERWNRRNATYRRRAGTRGTPSGSTRSKGIAMSGQPGRAERRRVIRPRSAATDEPWRALAAGDRTKRRGHRSSSAATPAGDNYVKRRTRVGD